MSQCQLYLFGAPRLAWDRQPINLPLRKAMALLVYLAVTRQPHSRDALATLLWLEKDQQGARANLRRTLYDLSQLLGQPHSDQLLLVEPESVSVRTAAPLWVDIERFQHTLAAYLPPTPTADITAHALTPLTAAADLWLTNWIYCRPPRQQRSTRPSAPSASP